MEPLQPETIRRACGHDAQFTPIGDRYDDARRAKMQSRRCPGCGLAKNAADNAAQKTASANRVKKGSEVKMLPEGTTVLLVVRNGKWQGALTADGRQVESTGGAMGVLNKLARKWLHATGAKLTGAVKE